MNYFKKIINKFTFYSDCLILNKNLSYNIQQTFIIGYNKNKISITYRIRFIDLEKFQKQYSFIFS